MVESSGYTDYIVENGKIVGERWVPMPSCDSARRDQVKKEPKPEPKKPQQPTNLRQ